MNYWANMVYNVQRKSVKTILNGPSTIQDDKSMNVGLRMNYAYDRKYIVELDASLMGSDKFIKRKSLGDVWCSRSGMEYFKGELHAGSWTG